MSESQHEALKSAFVTLELNHTEDDLTAPVPKTIYLALVTPEKPISADQFQRAKPAHCTLSPIARSQHSLLPTLLNTKTVEPHTLDQAKHSPLSIPPTNPSLRNTDPQRLLELFTSQTAGETCRFLSFALFSIRSIRFLDPEIVDAVLIRTPGFEIRSWP